MNKVFISHSSKDSEIVSSFISNILVAGLCMDRQNDIFCTSADGIGIKSGEDFKKRIKEEMEHAKAVIQILSPEYKKSEVCLNEMGAAWVSNCIVIPFTIPPNGYDVGFIHANTQQLRINSKDDLLSFFDDYKGTLFNKDISVVNYITQIERFLREITIITSIKNDKESFFYEETVKLIGTLRSGIFAGPPWGEEDIQNSSFHKYSYIELDKPINILSTTYAEEGNNNVNYFDQQKLHVAINTSKPDISISAFKDKRVEMVGTFMGGYTGWHQTQVLFFFDYIAAL